MTGGHAADGRATGGCCDANPNQKPHSHDTSRIAWAKLMARVGEEFPLQCPGCGGDIRLIAFITEPGPIRKSSPILANRSNRRPSLPRIARSMALPQRSSGRCATREPREELPGRTERVSRNAPHLLRWRFSRVCADRGPVGRSRGFDASRLTPVRGCGCRSRAARRATLERLPGRRGLSQSRPSRWAGLGRARRAEVRAVRREPRESSGSAPAP